MIKICKQKKKTGYAETNKRCLCILEGFRKGTTKKALEKGQPKRDTWCPF